ncbi:MAG: DUF485 domain-containing protein [Bryobacterales bacterium]|nr:DUF485 domain-containing protein [Bryobacterales bacterium]
MDPSKPSTSHLPEDGAPPADSPWQRIADGDDFRSLLRAKTRFIVAGTAFFLIYYFALPVLTGYWPELMGQKVLGPFSLAYVFALTQFPMAWLLAAAYLRAAAKFDRDAAAILARHLPAKANHAAETSAK